MNKKILTFLLISFLCIASACTDKEELPQPTPDQGDVSIGSGNPELMLLWKEGTGYSIRISSFGEIYTNPAQKPVYLEVFPPSLLSPKWYGTTYIEVVKQGERLVCKANIETDSGTEFVITDTYATGNSESSLSLCRTVVVNKTGNEDFAFNSYFLLQNKEERQVEEYEYFIPSLIYKDASYLSDSSIGSDFTHDWILAREERMGLPLAMLKEKKSGVSVVLAGYNRNPATFKGESGMGHFVKADMKFGSLGYRMTGESPALVYCFPGSEGERSYSDGVSYPSKRWARRSHPVKTDVEHTYELEFQFAGSMNFPEALEHHWKGVFNLYNPEVLDVTSETVLKNGLDLLNHYWIEKDGTPGFPFSVHLPGGEINEISYAMGFVGMQIPCAYYLYREGLQKGNLTYLEKGEKILDFWAGRSLTDAGMPQVWYDIAPWNFFRNSNDLRNMQGGLESMILAWESAEKHGQSKHNWLEYCIRAAGWLLDNQNPDGSWYKIYNNQNVVIDTGKLLTSNLIRFMAYMYAATRDERFRTAALRAGEFCYREIHEPYRYVGSVIDNPYVKDRESGQKIVEAFLALYDLTEDNKWLAAARQAAWYTVTYMYAWNIPVANGDSPVEWPVHKSSVGLTIIATGHSGADCGLSYNSYEFLRLYILTGDACFLRIAELLEKNTKQTMDYDGSLGYSHPGLQTEAIRVVTPRGYGVQLWLPWVTASALDPLFLMMDTYGDIDINRIGSRSLTELRNEDNLYRKNKYR